MGHKSFNDDDGGTAGTHAKNKPKQKIKNWVKYLHDKSRK